MTIARITNPIPKIDELPEDCAKLVLEYLEPEDQEISARVNQKFRQTFCLHLFDTIFPADFSANIGSIDHKISPISDLTHCFRRLSVATGLIQLPIKTAALLPKIGFSKHSGFEISSDLCVLSPDGKTFVVKKGTTSLELRDIITGACKKVLSGGGEEISVLAITLDGKTLISGSYGNEIKIWDAETGKCKKTLQGSKIDYNCGQTRNPNQTISMAVALDGKSFFSRSRYGIFQIWDTESGECKKTFEVDKNFSFPGEWIHDPTIAITSDGKNLVTFVPLKKSFIVLNIETGDEKQIPSVQGLVNKFMITSDGKWLIAQYLFRKTDVFIQMYDLENNRTEHLFGDHNVDVALTPDNKKVIAVSEDRTVKIYDIEKRCTTTSFSVSVTPYFEYSVLKVSSDGKSLIIIDQESLLKALTIYDIQSGKRNDDYLEEIQRLKILTFPNRDTFILRRYSEVATWKIHPLLKDVMAASSKSAKDIDRSTLINIIQSLKIIADRKDRPIQNLFPSAIESVIGRIKTLSPEIQQEIKEEVSRRFDPSVLVVKRALSPKQTLAQSFCDCIEELPSEMQDPFYDMYRRRQI